MRISRNILNNMMMDNQRKNPLYQTIITDLAITGNMDREDAEMLLGYKIPAFLHTPDGQSLEDEEDSDDENIPLIEAGNEDDEAEEVSDDEAEEVEEDDEAEEDSDDE